MRPALSVGPFSGRFGGCDVSPTAWVTLGAVSIAAPATAGTNLLLAVQCFAYHHRLRERPRSRAQLWACFFASMSIATLAGALKHGLRYELGDLGFAGVLWVSNVAGGLATYYAQRATILSHLRGRARRRVHAFVRAQLVGFLTANLALGPEMLLLIADTALGLLPVIGVEARAALRGRREGTWIATGFGISIGTAGVYLVRLSLEPWLNHIDIAHILLGASFFLIVRGADEVGAGAAVRLPCSAVGTEALR